MEGEKVKSEAGGISVRGAGAATGATVRRYITRWHTGLYSTLVLHTPRTLAFPRLARPMSGRRARRFLRISDGLAPLSPIWTSVAVGIPPPARSHPYSLLRSALRSQ